MGSFSDANSILQSNHPSEAAQLPAVLAALDSRSKYRRFLSNLRLEHFLPANAMLEVLRALIASYVAKGTPNVGKSLLGHWCEGDRIQCPKPALVGHVVIRKMFIDELRDDAVIGDRFKTYNSLNDEITQAIRTGDGTFLHNIFRLSPGKCFTTYAAWITWSTKRFQKDPFHWSKIANGSDIVCHLGLPSRYFGKELLLLIYSVRGSSIYRPTICDADPLSNFKVAPPDFEEHGWTDPLPDSEWPAEVRDLPESERPRAQPEGLHKAIPLIYLGLEAGRLPLRSLT